MYRSALTFGLLASLVMLMIMPFLNNNNSFSNTVMAQEYDKYGDSSYNTYPTDDKKYECRTGPFEGFFVSSVELCKFEFDKDDRDRKDYNNQTVSGGGGNAAEPIATLAVTKTVTCTLNDTNGPANEACEILQSNTPPFAFSISVIGSDSSFSDFLGSMTQWLFLWVQGLIG